MLRLLASAGPDDVAVCLLSGGGSALMPAPVNGRAAQGRRGGRRRPVAVHERRVLDLEDAGLGRAHPHRVGQAGADRDHGRRAAERVALEDLGQPGQRPPPGEAGVPELVGDRRVHVGDQGKAQQARERRRQVRGLFHRVHQVVAAGDHAPPGLGHERHVERELGQRGAGLTRPTGSGRLRRWRTPGTGEGAPRGNVRRSTSWPSDDSARTMCRTASGVPRTSKNG